MLTDNVRRTTNYDGRQSITIGHLTDSDDLQGQISLTREQVFNWPRLTNNRRRDMAEILPIRRKTLSNQSINAVL